MDDSTYEWEFPSDEEVDKITGARTVNTVMANEESGKHASPKKLPSGQQIIEVLTKVAEGELKGTRATLTLWVDITSPGFRKQVEMITGIEVTKGKKATLEDIEEALKSYSFHVTLGRNKNGYTIVKYLNERVAKVELEAEATIPTAYEGGGFSMGSDDDDDIPF